MLTRWVSVGFSWKRTTRLFFSSMMPKSVGMVRLAVAMVSIVSCRRWKSAKDAMFRSVSTSPLMTRKVSSSSSRIRRSAPTVPSGSISSV